MNELHISHILHTNENGVLTSKNSALDALTAMADHDISSVVIINHLRQPIGIFTEYDALKMVSDDLIGDVEISRVMSTSLFTINASTYLHDAYILMSDKGYRHIVVVDDDGIYLGIVSEGDFLRHMGFDHLEKVQIVENAMNKTPLIVEQNTTVRDVAIMMKDQHSDYAIVAEKLVPIGIVHERTVAHYIIHSKDQLNVPVNEAIMTEICTVSKGVLLEEAAALLTKHGIHQLVVIDETQKIVGLLQRFDVLKSIHGSYFDFLIKTIEQKSQKLEKMVEQEKILAEQTHLLETVINAIPDLIWLKNKEGTYLTCNRMFERLYNARREYIVGKNDYDFVSSDLAEFFQRHDNFALNAGKASRNEEFLTFHDGSYSGMFETTKTPLYDHRGEVLGVLGIAHDISERKQKEEELERIYTDLSTAEEMAHVGSWTWDLKTGVFSGSPEACRIYGVSEFESGGLERLLEIEHPEDREIVKQQLFEATKTGRYASVHRLLVNGQTKWVNVNAHFIKDADGNNIKAQGMLQDITVQKLYELELEKLANYDTLTGLANRTLLLNHLQKLIHRIQRDPAKHSAILLLDIDHFRDINDSFGHQMGDELLIQFAQRIQEKIRKEDFAAHLSGDEFVVVLENLHSKEDAAYVAKEMIAALSQSYGMSNRVELHINLSIGIVEITNDIHDPNSLIQFADSALYKAKIEGRNCYRFYSDDLTLLAQKRIQYQTELINALQNNEFELYYQPQVEMRSGAITGAEALIRWNHPAYGLVMPSDFIPIAEENGLISKIGEWTLYEACRQGKLWHDKGMDLHLSVNVSLQQLRYQNLIKVVESVLEKTEFDPEKLVLELTESAMMQHEEEFASMLHLLRDRGIKIAIDDFGTGYSSYSYLRKFPIDILKIDKSFVDHVPSSEQDVAIVKAIIAMAEILGYEILAEGIETLEQAEFLQSQGCQYFQGYFKSRPLSSLKFELLWDE